MNNEDLQLQTIHTMLYILNKVGRALDFHKLFKIMYFAERKHLAKYGRMITGDDYIKMNNGPVPSCAYDVLKNVKNKSAANYANMFKVFGGYNVEALCGYDEDEFSKSDIECLDASIEENIDLSFGQLTDKSHDIAWEEALFSLKPEAIAVAEGASSEMLDYIKEMNTLKNAQYF